MDAHDGNLPALLRNPTTDSQRSELVLRRQFNYLRSKTKSSSELCVVYEHIESRMSPLSATTTCKKVIEWMYGHEMVLPQEFRKPTTDAHRAEYLLRNQYKYLKLKTDKPPEVLALLDQIKQLSSSTTKCKNVLDWMDGCA